jgi:O-succinylbenzoic acid--CoA ligase
MTETCSQIATLSAAEAVTKVGSAGRPLPGVELRTTGDGELLVRGPMVAPGALSADGWLHTGDRGRLDAEGFVHVEGRLKDTIVTGGENVAAAEVEEALVSHPSVSDAAVVGVPDRDWGEVVTAYVVGDVSDEELTAHCRARLAAFKVPRVIYRVDELPRNAAGKLLKGRLPDRVPRP